MKLGDKNISTNNAALNINIITKDEIKENIKIKKDYTQDKI